MFRLEMSEKLIERMNKDDSMYSLEIFNDDLYKHGWVIDINDGKIVACYIEN